MIAQQPLYLTFANSKQILHKTNSTALPLNTTTTKQITNKTRRKQSRCLALEEEEEKQEV